jgi:uncharacterized protein YqeY
VEKFEDIQNSFKSIRSNFINNVKDNVGVSIDKEQLEVIEQYLPKQLSEEEIREALKTIISELGATSPKDMGKVMGELKKHAKSSQIDNSIASKIVKELLV